MNEEEKKARIKELWGKLRMHVKTMNFVRHVQSQVESEIFVDVTSVPSYKFNFNDLNEKKQEDPLMWYLIDVKSTCMIFWELIVSLLCLWTYITMPLFLIFPHLVGTKITTCDIIFEILWIIEIIMSFFKVPIHMKQPITLRDTANSYLGGKFWFDMLATIPSITFKLLRQTRMAFACKVFRWVHITRLPMPLQLGFEKFSGLSKQRRRDWIKICIVFGYALLIAHNFACVWIALGLSDRDKPVGEQ